MSFNPLGHHNLATQHSAQHKANWPEATVAVCSVLSLGITGFGAVKDSSAANLGAAAIIFVSLSFLIGRRAISRHQQRRAIRLEEDAARERNANFATITSKALSSITEQLSFTHNNSNTAIYALEQLTSPFQGKLPAEVNLRRETVRAHCMVFKDLPEKVTSEQAPQIARILDQALHRLIEDLPQYLSDVEKAANALPGWEGPHIANQTAILRERFNQIITDYNPLARQSRELDFYLLNSFDTSKNLRPPPRQSPPQ